MTNSGWPNSTGSPFSARTATTLPAASALDLVHHLHRLDDAEHLADPDFLAHLDEGLRAGRGRAVEGADHGRRDEVFVAGCRVAGAAVGGRRVPRPRAAAAAMGRGGYRHGSPAAWTLGVVRGDAHRLLALGDFDFGEP